MALVEGTGRVIVLAGKLLPRAVLGLVVVESLTPSAIRRRAWSVETENPFLTSMAGFLPRRITCWVAFMISDAFGFASVPVFCLPWLPVAVGAYGCSISS